MREKALRDEISAIAGAKAEGREEGRAEGKVEMARDAICKYLEVRFGEASKKLQKQVRQIGKLGILDKMMNDIYTATNLEEAQTVIKQELHN
ncbi:hypothetical protein [Desulfolucanica intricata]|uniref:hypothetical protein n=1 Tax=Desulfolucanica intricata TaxID=1285191 RepID=UPI000AEEB63D|nr:hypothetical protein [Desulfolucanica intricata]